jgi:hypothetical protein
LATKKGRDSQIVIAKQKSIIILETSNIVVSSPSFTGVKGGTAKI